MQKIQRVVAVGALAGLTAIVGACGGATDTATGGDTGGGAAQQPTEATQPSTGGGESAAQGQGVTTTDQIYGPACDQVPTSGPGSAQGMVDDPVGTAASNNPLLTTLTKAVQQAGLVDTLNNPDAQFTVFAPANSAFEKLPPGTLDQLSKEQLTNILTYHVVPTRYDAEGLAEAGQVETVQGDTLQIMGQQGSLSLDDTEQAKVLCGNIPTANATVFVIDTVMMPGNGGGGQSASTEPQG